MHLDIDRFFKEIISLSKGIIVPIVLAIILVILYPVDNIIIFVIYAIILSATYAISVWCMGMNEEEKNLVRKIIYRGKNGESNG